MQFKKKKMHKLKRGWGNGEGRKKRKEGEEGKQHREDRKGGRERRRREEKKTEGTKGKSKCSRAQHVKMNSRNTSCTRQSFLAGKPQAYGPS